MHIYGIKNCGSVKKALNWLDDRGISYTFHDYKKEGVTEQKLREWENKVGWEVLLNKRGTTWRQIPAAEQERIVDADSAIGLLAEHTSAIKRPVIEHGSEILVGFDEALYAEKIK